MKQGYDFSSFVNLNFGKAPENQKPSKTRGNGEYRLNPRLKPCYFSGITPFYRSSAPTTVHV